MFKLFSLALTIFSLIVAVQCLGVPPCPTDCGRSKPSSHAARGSICVFKCPENNVEGNNLSTSIHDSTRLNCRYTTSNARGLRAACVYNKHTGELLNDSGHSKCPGSALFYCPRAGMANDERTKLRRSNKAKRGES